MDTPVYKLWIGKPRLEVALMAQERIAEYLEKEQQIKKDLGIRDLLYGSIWSNERYTGFGAQQYPGWKAVREHVRCLDELHWFQYLQTETYLGVPREDEPVSLEPLALDPQVDWIAMIYLARDKAAMFDISEAEMAEGMKAFEQMKTLGFHEPLSISSLAFNEEWSGWGIQLFPSLEALQQKVAIQEKVKWWKFIAARTFLGTLEGGDLVKK